MDKMKPERKKREEVIEKAKKLGPIKGEDIKKLPSVNSVVSKLEKHGVTAEKLAEKLNDGLEATKPVIVDGEILDYTPDYMTRYRYAELLLKVRGDMANIPSGAEKGIVNVQVNVVDLGERIAMVKVNRRDHAEET